MGEYNIIRGTTEVMSAELGDEHPAGEYFWGCELSKDRQSVTWSTREEEDDADYMSHSLFIKQAVLGAQAVKDELNIIEVHTKNYDREDVKQPFISLTRGENSMCSLDVSFNDSYPVTFTLTNGTGPVYLTAVHLVEFPGDGDQTMDEEGFTEEEEETPEKPKLKAKRKGGATAGGTKAKKSKMMEACAEESDEESEEEEDDEDEDEEMDDDDDEEEEDPTPEKKKAAKKKNAKPKASKKVAAVKPKKAAKKAK